MSFYDWMLAMRRKPIEERRRFAATLTILVMAGITFVWFVFFFAGLSEKFKNTEAPASATASVLDAWTAPQLPFPSK